MKGVSRKDLADAQRMAAEMQKENTALRERLRDAEQNRAMDASRPVERVEVPVADPKMKARISELEANLSAAKAKLALCEIALKKANRRLVSYGGATVEVSE